MKCVFSNGEFPGIVVSSDSAGLDSNSVQILELHPRYGQKELQEKSLRNERRAPTAQREWGKSPKCSVVFSLSYIPALR